MLEQHQYQEADLFIEGQSLEGGYQEADLLIGWVYIGSPHYGVPVMPLSTTYLITQRVRQTFTGWGKVFTLLGYYVSLGDTIPTEILASQVYQHA